jgi:tetratricopeptide (TPR) repeat protein
MGYYERAETLNLKTKALREKMNGKDHPYYAMVLGNLAQLNLSIGNYEKAEPCFQQVNSKLLHQLLIKQLLLHQLQLDSAGCFTPPSPLARFTS